jgi:hypothetical protein
MTEEVKQILVIILGVIASILMVAGGLTTKRKKLLVLLASLSVVCISQYVILGATIAMAISVVGIVRYALLYFFEEEHPWVNSIPMALAFIMLHVLAFTVGSGFYSQELHAYDFIPLVGAILGTLSFMFSNMVIVKTLMVAIGSIWLAYEFIIGAYGQMVGEALTLVANVVAIVYLIRSRMAGVPEADIPDLNTQVIHTLTTPVEIIKPISEALTRPIQVVKDHTAPNPTV